MQTLEPLGVCWDKTHQGPFPSQRECGVVQVLSDTSMFGVPINSRIMFTFLQACWGANFTREQVARVFAEVAAMRAHRQPDQSVFSALLTFAQKHLPEQAVGVWAALQEVSHASSS